MENKKKDFMIGRKFKKWTVLEYFPGKKPGKYYECICDCGTIAVKAGTELRAFRSTQCIRCKNNFLYDPEREIGKRYGKWKVIKFIDIHRNLQRFECKCICGFRRLHCVADLRAGKSTQCTTCHNREIAQRNTKHGMHKTKIYKIWSSMRDRCNNPNNTAYKYYGARGIKVCKRWHKFENFYRDMGDQPPGLTLDRINNDGNYTPTNCRWISHKENCQNRRKRCCIAKVAPPIYRR